MHMLGPSTEIDVASAAPGLEHADLILGIRTIDQMFGGKVARFVPWRS
jgi:hypothetical protein